MTDVVQQISRLSKKLSHGEAADAIILTASRLPRGDLLRTVNELLAIRAASNLLSPEASETLRQASLRVLQGWAYLVSKSDFLELAQKCRLGELGEAVRPRQESEERSQDASKVLVGIWSQARDKQPDFWLQDRTGKKIAVEIKKRLTNEIESVAGLVPEDQLIDLAASMAARHRHLEGKAQRLRSTLSLIVRRDQLVHEQAGMPREFVSADDLWEALQNRIAGEAIAAIWQEPMLEPKEVAKALGARPSNREKVRALRERSSLLGLPRGRSFVYPAFQIDAAKRRVYPEVLRVNQTLGAANDPWGVASWWVSTNDWLGERPLALVGTDRAREVEQAAISEREPLG